MALQTVDGGAHVGPGYYFCVADYTFEVVGDGGATLPGPASRKFLDIPFPALFLIIPVISFAFLIFLPAAGFGMVAVAVMLKLIGQGGKAKPAKVEKGH